MTNTELIKKLDPSGGFIESFKNKFNQIKDELALKIGITENS